MHHLLTLEDLDRATITRLLDRAERYRADGAPRDLLAGRTVLTLFFEPSTRTRTSFVLAAKRLGADNVNFDLSRSSTSKGEACSTRCTRWKRWASMHWWCGTTRTGCRRTSRSTRAVMSL